jgi:AcrR family transcriptional regulator
MTDPEACETRRVQTRERLISAATALFHHHGVHASSVDEIAAAASLSKPTLYRHFPSKADLVVACLREEGRQTRRALTEAVERTPCEPSQRIRAIGEHFVAKFADAPNRGLFALNLAVEYSRPETPIHEAIHAEIERLHDHLVLLIAPAAPVSVRPIAGKLALAIFGASAACQAVGAMACDHLVESVEGIISEFRA